MPIIFQCDEHLLEGLESEPLLSRGRWGRRTGVNPWRSSGPQLALRSAPPPIHLSEVAPPPGNKSWIAIPDGRPPGRPWPGRINPPGQALL